MEESKKLEKRKKPWFIVKEAKFSARVKPRWRFPRGRHSSTRQRHKGRPALPTPGYGAPKAIRGLHRLGLKEVVVHNAKELEALNLEKEGAIIGSTVSKKKKLELLKLAAKKYIPLLNVKDVEVLIKKIETEFEGRKKAKEEKLKTKSKKEAEKEKKAEEKKQKEAEKEKKEEEEPIEEKVKKEQEEQEEQKKMAEKTITKRQ